MKRNVRFSPKSVKFNSAVSAVWAVLDDDDAKSIADMVERLAAARKK